MLVRYNALPYLWCDLNSHWTQCPAARTRTIGTPYSAALEPMTSSFAYLNAAAAAAWTQFAIFQLRPSQQHKQRILFVGLRRTALFPSLTGACMLAMHACAAPIFILTQAIHTIKPCDVCQSIAYCMSESRCAHTFVYLWRIRAAIRSD